MKSLCLLVVLSCVVAVLADRRHGDGDSLRSSDDGKVYFGPQLRRRNVFGPQLPKRFRSGRRGRDRYSSESGPQASVEVNLVEVVAERSSPLDVSVSSAEYGHPHSFMDILLPSGLAGHARPGGSFLDLVPLSMSSPVVPPPHEKTAAMARFIVHTVNWAAIATKSTLPATRGLPFASVFSVSDGLPNASSGVPYMYLSGRDVSVQDLRADNHASLTMSLAQTSYCRNHQYDPESPLCAHVILMGHVVVVPPKTPEHARALEALYVRHPEMKSWPADHQFFVAKLDITSVLLLDYYGGMTPVPVEAYFNVTFPVSIALGN